MLESLNFPFMEFMEKCLSKLSVKRKISNLAINNIKIAKIISSGQVQPFLI